MKQRNVRAIERDPLVCANLATFDAAARTIDDTRLKPGIFVVVAYFLQIG
jgi:hypothetical protein